MNNNSKDIEKLTTETTEFKREIGVFGGVSIIGGIMIGSGIFYLGSYVLQRTGMNSGLALSVGLLVDLSHYLVVFVMQNLVLPCQRLGEELST